jgi:protein TonB
LLVQQVRPNYPPIARQARVQGVVLLSVVIGPTGKVDSITTISGPAMLRQAAIDAVSQWVYKPFLLNSKPVPVITEVEVNFALVDNIPPQ